MKYCESKRYIFGTFFEIIYKEKQNVKWICEC